MDIRCRYKNLQVLEEIYKKGKSVIGVVGHYGNWEYLIGLQLHTKFQVLGLYKPLHNEFFDKFLFDIRKQFGMIPVPVKKTLKTLFDFQNKKQQTLIIIVGDQTPPKKEVQYWTKFLNQDTAVYLGIEKIAKKMDQVVVYIHINKTKRGHYEVSFEELFKEAINTKEYEVSEKHVRVLEKSIKQNPEYWLWSHKRWKHKKEDFVKKDKE
jgi:KDO2-lipid IV(A) lauroyltransferase